MRTVLVFRQVWLEMGLGQTDGIQRMICLHREWEMEYESTYKDFTGRCVVIHCIVMVPLCLMFSLHHMWKMLIST